MRSPLPRQVRRSGRLSILMILLLGVGAVSSAEQDPIAEEGVWITLGADAFATLATVPDLGFRAAPLRKAAERDNVVLTRVEARDLSRISDVLHAAHRRCAGFMLHPTLAQALETLAGAAGERLPGPSAPFTIDQGPAVQRLEAALQKSPMLNSIERLSTDFNNRFHAHPSGTAAAQWIHDQWQTYTQSREDINVELFQHSGTTQPSVILTIAGTTWPEEVVVLGGHLDSTAPGRGDPDFLAPGADDDASGIAVLSELIRVVVAQSFMPARTVAFMAYAAEEIGLVGSQEIADAYATAGIDVVAVLQLDMTDFNGSAEDIALIDDFTDGALTGFLADLVDTYQPELLWTLTTCGYGCSDHASWTLEGFAAAFPFEARFGEHNPWIHTTNDTLDTLNNSVDHAYKFARLAAAFMVEVAKEGSIFVDGFESGDTSAWSATLP